MSLPCYCNATVFAIQCKETLEHAWNFEDIDDAQWDDAIDWSVPVTNPSSSYQPLFKIWFDAEEILKQEQSLVEDSGESSNVPHTVKGGKKENVKMKNEAPEGIEYLDFDTFMKVELRVGRIVKVENHPNAARLFVVHLDDGSGKWSLFRAEQKNSILNLNSL